MTSEVSPSSGEMSGAIDTVAKYVRANTLELLIVLLILAFGFNQFLRPFLEKVLQFVLQRDTAHKQAQQDIMDTQQEILTRNDNRVDQLIGTLVDIQGRAVAAMEQSNVVSAQVSNSVDKNSKLCQEHTLAVTACVDALKQQNLSLSTEFGTHNQAIAENNQIMLQLVQKIDIAAEVGAKSAESNAATVQRLERTINRRGVVKRVATAIFDRDAV